MDRPDTHDWDPVLAALEWKLMGNTRRRITQFRPLPALSFPTNDSGQSDDSD